MKKYLWTVLPLLWITACELPPRNPAQPDARPANEKARRDHHDGPEEYVLVTTGVTMPLYVNHDLAAFRRWGKERNVTVSVIGLKDLDISAQINTIEQAILSRPSGLLINGSDPALAQVINKAVDEGIPTVTYDSDVPNCRRNAFIGSDWYQIGQTQGEAMAKLLNGRGKVAYMGIVGLPIMEKGFQGLLDALKKYPGIQVIGKYDDKGNVEEAARIASDLIAANPDLGGLCGFDSNSGPGIGVAIGEAGKAGKVMATTVDWEPRHLQLVKEGIIQLLVGQKRELFTWYGAQFLYDQVHATVQLSRDDGKAGVSSIPYSINTGSILITKENIDQFLK
ncbi:MAG TPA: substrate-binding domain-containing protein [Puia sp.]